MEMQKLADDQNRVIISRTETDYAPRPMRPSNWDIFCLAFAIVAHVVDLGTDINVAYRYYSHGEHTYFICTVIVILVPSVVNSFVSARMYIADAQQEISVKANQYLPYRCIVLLLHFAPVLRYVDSLRFACKARQAEKKGNVEEQEKNYRLMLKEDADVALLRVFECFLEAAPQQVLQVSFLLRGVPTHITPGAFSSFSVTRIMTGPVFEVTMFETVRHVVREIHQILSEGIPIHSASPSKANFDGLYHQIISIASSFASMAWALLTYQRSIRFTQEDKDNISCIGSVCILFWHFFVTVSRIVMLSALAALFWTWTLVAMGVHWIVMTISLALLESHNFCTSPMIESPRIHEKILNFLFSSVLALVYIFTYLTPGEGGTRGRYAFFYGICIIENIGGCVIWNEFCDESTRQKWFFYPVSVACVVPFVLGCLIMILYYIKFHPTYYGPPSIIPQRRQRAPSTGSHPPSTTSSHPPEVVLNGTVPLCQTQPDVVGCNNKAPNEAA